MKFRRIMVAIKPWQRGLPLASNHARQLAQGSGACIELVSSVYDASIAGGRERGDPAAQRTHDRVIGAARVELERLARSMRDWGAQVTTRIVWGVPAYEAIVAAANEWGADLLVAGAHEGAALRPRFTDIDLQLMRLTGCPLLLVKNPAFNGYRTIVAAVDPLHARDEPDGLDRAVLAASRCIAQSTGSTVRAVYAYPGPEAFALASAVQVAPGVFYGTENITDLHRRAVSELAAEYGIGASEIDLVEGIPAEAIIDVAARRRAELVVVGLVQAHGLAAALMGHTAEHVAAAVPCDVLIVPAAEESHAGRGLRSQIG
jgi:universal stress protein E